jgi:hypothetical protein
MSERLQSHGGDHRVTVIGISIVPNRLVHFSVDGPKSWKLRDFITRRILTSDASNQTADAIRQAATFQEAQENVLFVPLDKLDRWTTFLVNRSRAVYGAAYDAESIPLSLWGEWAPF